MNAFSPKVQTVTSTNKIRYEIIDFEIVLYGFCISKKIKKKFAAKGLIFILDKN